MMIRMQTTGFFKGKNIMITGHTGFIGSWLTKQLVMLKANVCGYSLDPPTNPNMFEAIHIGREITDIRGDVRSKEHLHKTVSDFQPSIVFHLAAQPIVLESYTNPTETFETNVIGTVNLLDTLRKVASTKTTIIVTSDKTYQNNEWVYPYRETDPLGGKDPYSASKSCQDIVVNSFKESYFSDSGIGVSAVRAGNVIGGGDWARDRLIPDIVRGIANRETVVIRNPDSVRPWQHVLEPVSGMLTLAEKMWENIKYSGAWNFGPNNQKKMSVKELADKFIDCWGKGSYKIQKSTDAKEADYLQLDISKAKQELGWSPVYDMESRVKETVEWYQTYYSKGDVEKTTLNQITSYYTNKGYDNRT